MFNQSKTFQSHLLLILSLHRLVCDRTIQPTHIKFLHSPRENLDTLILILVFRFCCTKSVGKKYFQEQQHVSIPLCLLSPFPIPSMFFYVFFPCLPYTLMTFGRLNCVMLGWFYCCLLPVGNSWHCSLFSIDIHFQQYCFLLDSCTVSASQAEYVPHWPPSFKCIEQRNKQDK